VGPSELGADGEKGELVAGFAKPFRKNSDGVPEHVVREIHPQEKQIGKPIARHVEQSTPLVDARVGRARSFVEQTHLAKHFPPPENGQRFLAHAGNVAAYPNFAFENEKEAVARIAVGEDERAQGVRFFRRDRGDGFERFRRQSGEQMYFRQHIDVIT
jgi:hypothetical protein